MNKQNALKGFVFVVIATVFMSCNSASKNKSETIMLFNGKNLENWKGDTNVWSVEEGCIIGKTTDDYQIKQNTFLTYKNEFSNFELTFQYKIIGGNSGVQYRAKVLDEQAFVIGGYQADMEAGINYSGILYEEKGRGIMANRGEQVTILENGKKEVGIKVVSKGKTVYVYLDTPYSSFNFETGRFMHNEYNVKRKYSYTLDITIKVPNNSSLKLSAVNKGEIVVENIDAKEIKANNINGAITLNQVAGKIDVNALNKDINVSFSKNPTSDSHFNSLNGDINILAKKGLNADVFFKSLNGDIYTNINTTIKPSKAKIEKKEGRKGTKYKVGSNSAFSFGDGGIQLNFDLLNGDVTIKE